MRGVPLPVQYASEVGAFALAWAPGHADSEVGLALVSAAHHVKLQSWISITGLNWLVMHLCSVGHSLKSKSDIKGSIFFPWCLNAISSFNIQKSARDPWQIGAIFSIQFCLFFPFFEDITNPPCTPSPVLNFLTPCLPLSIHEVFFSLLILAFWLALKLLLCLAVSFSLSPTLIPGKCRSFPDKLLKQQSLWRSSAELCQKMCGNSLDGKEKGLLIVFLSFFFFSWN